MNINFCSLELNRSHEAHLGTAKIIDRIEKFNQKVNSGTVTETEKPQGSFESMVLEAVSEMNSQQLKVSSLQEQIITDPDSVDIHDVTTAMAKAQMSLNLAQTVIERMVKGWTDLSQNR